MAEAKIRNEIIKLTSDLIRFKSIKSEPNELYKIINFIIKYFSKDQSKLIIKKYNKNKKPSIVILPKGVKKPKLLFLSHADVVEAESEKDFIPKVQGNKLLGRGSADMKAGLAISMVLFKKYHKTKSIGLMITTDEELGGHNGAGYVSKLYKTDFIIASEPTYLNIVIKEKGVIWLKLIAKGKACHGSRPWLGENAIDILIKTYEKLRKKFPHINKDCWETTMNLGVIQGGKAPNIVAPSAEMKIDIRYIEKYKALELVEQIKKLVTDKRVKLEIIEAEPMMLTAENDKKVLLLAECFKEITKRKASILKEHGASDARFFSERKISCAVFGPSGHNYHGRNEYLDIDSTVKCYAVLERYVQKHT
ncbi:MAG: M20 family metallopeptidase [Nanoarchaeota archaeon]|nr:M20 family metallopeptidase [Nanoarchaeota archaeon]MBU1321625.1 M20 family metallopeptidase [Nanoarchaeota archaeon]MBU1597409.1 M20 family metallopeptidase [Nanoarchaeota archaeon]MBU2440928.1 M20 family metallopeptidase [Nanoarchaeota archaeon]